MANHYCNLIGRCITTTSRKPSAGYKTALPWFRVDKLSAVFYSLSSVPGGE